MTTRATPFLLLPVLLVSALTACAGKPSGSTPAPAPTPSTAGAPAASGAAGAATGSGAGTTASGPAVTLVKAPRARIDQQLITRDVIRSTQYTNLYDVIQALRSTWLRARPAESIEGKSSALQIYLDNQRLAGGADELRQMSPLNIESVRYYDPIQASARWGMDHGSGALLILTAKK